MRITVLGLALSLPLAAAAILSLAGAARADSPPYTVSVASGTVTVSVGTGYHINTQFPWKVAQGTTPPAGGGTAPTLADKTKFSLAATSATLANAPKGTNTLKGAYCSVDSSGNTGSCTPFSTTITVP
jgi:hypothetical protein